MSSALVSSKGQVVIPAELRRRYAIEAGTRLDFVDEGDALRIVVRPVGESACGDDGFGLLKYRGPRRSLLDFDVSDAMRREAQKP